MEDDQFWRKLNRSDMSQVFSELKNALDEYEMNAKTTKSSSEDTNQKTGAIIPPPIVVLGTAGTGTRVFHQLLASAGVLMSRVVNGQKDSRIFIDIVKNNDGFGRPGLDAPSPDEEALTAFLREQPESEEHTISDSLFDWMHRHGKMDYEMEDIINEPFFESLLQAAQGAKRVFEFEVESRLAGDPSQPNRTRWGFKEPQAVFVLPFLESMWRDAVNKSGERLTIVHVVRDGRDISFSKQQRRKYQNFYVSKLHPHTVASGNTTEQDQLSLQWEYAKAVASVWEYVNLAIRKWAQRHPDTVRYVMVRLEDVCREESRLEAVGKFYKDANVEAPNEKELKELLLKIVDEERCHIGKYLVGSNDCVVPCDRSLTLVC
jgi:hypothetical protein